MNGRAIDVVIVGGGLAGGLIALAVHRAHPKKRVLLLESGANLGGNHRWSWFESDLSIAGTTLLEPFRKVEWNSGYDVIFPHHCRRLGTGYRSLSSRDFEIGLRRLLPPDWIRTETTVAALDSGGVTLAEGERVDAHAVIDCRGFEPTPHLSGGWQVFMGKHIRLEHPHGYEYPTIMDASVPQLAPAGDSGAYRFIYVLPLTSHELFVEDTYYHDTPELDREALSARIDKYAAAIGCDNGEVLEQETGILPVITGGDFGAYQASIARPGVALAGARGGFAHPLTSYTLPIAVSNALAIANEAELSGSALEKFLGKRAQRHWNSTSIYRKLGRMLFDAAIPEQRVDIFERFYRLPEGLIERFYSGRSGMTDKARILIGRPPVPIVRAIKALAGSGRPLLGGKSA